MRVSVGEAFSILGLSPRATEEEAKSAYKRLALSSHPDKATNRDEASLAASTARFQQISASWEALQRHYAPPPTRPSMPYGFHPAFAHRHAPDGGHFHYAPDTSTDDDDDDSMFDDDEDSYYDDSDIEEELNYFHYMFNNMFTGAGTGSYGRRSDYFRSRQQSSSQQSERKRETPVEQATRMKKAREARLAAEKRRVEEDRLRRERREAEARQDAIRAAERKQEKSAKKRAAAEATKEAIAAKAREAKLRSQVKRSAAFNAARRGASAMVQEAVWEDGVQASEGEWLAGLIRPKSDKNDPKESLLHLAAGHPDVELVQWLLDHGAVPEERDAKDCTFFHRALVQGHVPLIERLLSIYPPADVENEGVVRPPVGESLLSLVVSSGRPEAVQALLPHSTLEQVGECIAWLDSLTPDASILDLRAALATKKSYNATPPPSLPSQPPTPVTPVFPTADPVTAPKKRKTKRTKTPLQPVEVSSPASTGPPTPPLTAPEPSRATKRPPTSSIPSSAQPSPAPSIKLNTPLSSPSTGTAAKKGPPRRRRKAAAQPTA